MATDGTGALSVASTAAPVSRPVAVDGGLDLQDRRCARPDCTDPARATLSFSYGDQHAVLTRLTTDRRPQAYDLCPLHAARTTAPHGWHLRDDRPEDERAEADAPAVPSDLGSDRTVAVLAAALRAVPSASSRVAERVSTPSTAAPTGTTSASDTAATDPDPATIDALIDLDDDAAQVARAGWAERAERAEPSAQAQPAPERAREPAPEPAPEPAREHPARPEPAAATKRTTSGEPTARPDSRQPRPVLAARGPGAVPGGRTSRAADW